MRLTKSSLIIILLTIITSHIIQAQVSKADFRGKFETKGKEVYNYLSTNIRTVDTNYHRLSIDKKTLQQNIGTDIVNDLNSSPQFTQLSIEISLLFSKRDSSQIYFPRLDDLQYIEVLNIRLNHKSEFPDSLASQILKMPRLRYLSIQSTKINGSFINALSKKIDYLVLPSSIENLEIISGDLKGLYFTNYDQKTIVSILHAIKDNPHLESLSMKIDTFTQEIAPYISDLKNIKDFTFDCRHFDDKIILNLGDNQLEHVELKSNVPVQVLKSIPTSVKKLDINLDDDEAILALPKLEHLEYLNAYFGKKTDSINHLDFSKFPNLTQLKLTGKASKLNQSFCELRQLNAVDLSYLKLDALPPCIGKLKQLKHLDASNNKLQEIPKSFVKLDHLEDLNVRHNSIKSLPKKLKKLKRLKSLNLSFNELTEIPNSVTELPWLQKLLLNDNQLKSFPKEIKGLKHLKHLKLGNNCVNRIPEDIGSLQSLESLFLTNEVRKDDKMDKKITLCDISIDHIPTSITQLHNLKELTIVNAGLSSVQDITTVLSIPSDGLEINLSKNFFAALPEYGWENTYATKLNLYDNKIESLNPAFYSHHLSEIDLRKNKLGIYNQKIDTPTKLALIAYNEELISRESLMQFPDIVKTIISVSSRYYSNPENNPILDYYSIGMDIDSSYILEHISKDNFAEALFKAKRYQECIPYYNESINEDLSSGIMFVNAVAASIDNRKEAYLHIGDTLNALNDLKLINSRFQYDMSSEIMELYLKISEPDSTRLYGKKTIEYYKSQIDKNESQASGLWLSILEIGVILSDENIISDATAGLSKITLNNNEKIIREYLLLLSPKNIRYLDDSIVESMAKNATNVYYSNDSWNCSLIEDWTKAFKLETRSLIKKLNKVICP